MRSVRSTGGYTLVEIVVALLVFTVGGLALAASSAVVARGMAANAIRELAGRIASSRIEVLKSQCPTATSGSETVQQIESQWSVVGRDSSRISVVESVSYRSAGSWRTDIYRAELACER